MIASLAALVLTFAPSLALLKETASTLSTLMRASNAALVLTHAL
jgi:hypothetical protein